MKTNATRVLDNLGIHYELRDYEVDPDDLRAEVVAAKVGLPRSRCLRLWWRAVIAMAPALP